MNFKKITVNLLGGTALVLLLASCSSTKNIVSEEIQPLGASRIMRKVLAESPRYQIYSSKKMNVDFDINGTKNSISASFQVERDDEIYMSIRKLNFPVGKIKVTTDSISIVNYLQKSYLYGDIEAAQYLMGANVDFRLLQAVLTADMRALTDDDIYNKNLISVIDNGMYRIDSQVKGKIGKAIEKGKDKRLSRYMDKMDPDDFVNFSIWVDPQLFVVRKIQLQNEKDDETITLSYDNYEKIQRQKFPCEASFEYLSKDKKIVLDLEIVKQTINKREDVAFTIPDKYKRINISDL